MTDWKKVHASSRAYIRAQAASGLFVAAVYVVIGIFGLVLLARGRPVETPLGILFVAIGVIGGSYLGLQAYREYFGDPIVLTARVLRKQDAASISRTGVLRRYYLQVEITKAVSVAAEGELTIAPYLRMSMIPSSEPLYKALNDGDAVLLVCTPTGHAFATLDALA